MYNTIIVTIICKECLKTEGIWGMLIRVIVSLLHHFGICLCEIVFAVCAHKVKFGGTLNAPKVDIVYLDVLITSFSSCINNVFYINIIIIQKMFVNCTAFNFIQIEIN